MPSSIVQSFAKKTGKSEAEIEKKWDEAKAIARKEYPDKTGDDYYAIVTGILKNMLGLKESFDVLLNDEHEKLKELKS